MDKRGKARIIQECVTKVILILSLAALAVCALIGMSLHSCVDTENLSELTPEYAHNGMLQIIVAFCLLAATGVFILNYSGLIITSTYADTQILEDRTAVAIQQGLL